MAAVRAALDAGDHRCAIAMGGDGTFREVAADVLESRRHDDVALGMLPTGTANDQGRSFGLEASEEALPRNVAVIAAGRETRLDAGKIHALTAEGATVAEAMFFDSAGFGISARVLAARNADRRVVEQLGPIKELYRDHLVYAGALLRTFLESYVISDKFDATVTVDGAVHQLTDLTDLIVKGTRIYAGAWVFDRASRHDDGLFEMVPFRGKRDWMSKAMVDIDGNPITEEMLNTIGGSHSKPFSGARINLRFSVPEGRAALCAQIDGEVPGEADPPVSQGFPLVARQAGHGGFETNGLGDGLGSVGLVTRLLGRAHVALVDVIRGLAEGDVGQIGGSRDRGGRCRRGGAGGRGARRRRGAGLARGHGGAGGGGSQAARSTLEASRRSAVDRDMGLLRGLRSSVGKCSRRGCPKMASTRPGSGHCAKAIVESGRRTMIGSPPPDERSLYLHGRRLPGRSLSGPRVHRERDALRALHPSMSSSRPTPRTTKRWSASRLDSGRCSRGL